MSSQLSSIKEPQCSVDAFDAKLFRRCLAQFSTGVTIITAQVGANKVGVTANSFSSLSLDPPLVLWSISKTSRSFESFLAASHFAVNILASDQIAVSQAFSSSDTDKFRGIGWLPGNTGSPVLDGVIGSIECAVENTIDAGDHVVLIGRVLTFQKRDGEPLVFTQGRYAIAVDHPDTKLNMEKLRTAASTPSDHGDRLFFRLLYQAFHAMSESFDAHRKAERLTFVQLRVLIGTYEQPGISIEGLSRVMHITRQDAGEASGELAERGLLIKDENAVLTLTESGVQLREAISQREHQFNLNQLSGLDKEDIRAARRVLQMMIERNSLE